MTTPKGSKLSIKSLGTLFFRILWMVRCMHACMRHCHQDAGEARLQNLAKEICGTGRVSQPPTSQVEG